MTVGLTELEDLIIHRPELMTNEQRDKYIVEVEKLVLSTIVGLADQIDLLTSENAGLKRDAILWKRVAQNLNGQLLIMQYSQTGADYDAEQAEKEKEKGL